MLPHFKNPYYIVLNGTLNSVFRGFMLKFIAKVLLKYVSLSLTIGKILFLKEMARSIGPSQFVFNQLTMIQKIVCKVKTSVK